MILIKTVKIKSIIIFALLIFCSCDETSQTVVSVNDEFTKVGNGTMVSTVVSPGDQLNLKGKLELTSGEFSIFLSDPTGDTIYSESFKKAGTYKIDKYFDRKIGNWVFSYDIKKIENEIPSGNFDFDLIYND